MPCLLLVKARQTNELGKAEEGKPESSVRQGKGRQRKAEEGKRQGKRQGRADENTEICGWALPQLIGAIYERYELR